MLSMTEKKEWLFLLPRMTEQEIKELDRILSIKLPSKVFNNAPPSLAGASRGGQPPLDLRGRERELRAPVTDIKPPAPQAPAPTIMNRPRISEPPAPPAQKNIESRILNIEKPKPQIPLPVKKESTIPKADIPNSKFNIPASIRRPDAIPQKPVIPELAKLASLSMEDLRRESSIYVFLENLNQYILSLIAKRIPAEEILLAFEKSPLHKSYLKVGMALLNHEKNTELSREEFETLTDFRTNLKRL